jgi:uncharacterized protein (TIGR02453 family)
MFSADTLKFLRALKRNNRRDWFLKHRAEYDAHVRAPMVAAIERLAVDLRAFAPDLTADPKRSMYRIYRDVRFSPNKAPYKTHVAAVFPCRALPRHEGAGLYFHVSPDEVWIGGGMYAPQPPQLHAVREHIAANLRRFRSIVEAPSFRRTVGALEGERLQRVPLGFRKDDPAAEYLKFRQFLAGRQLEPDAAASAGFYRTVVNTFRQIAPLIHFLNEPLLGPASTTEAQRAQRIGTERSTRSAGYAGRTGGAKGPGTQSNRA